MPDDYCTSHAEMAASVSEIKDMVSQIKDMLTGSTSGELGITARLHYAEEQLKVMIAERLWYRRTTTGVVIATLVAVGVAAIAAFK